MLNLYNVKLDLYRWNMTKKSIQNITGNKSQKHYEAFASKHGLIFTPNITDHDEPVKGVTHTKNCRDKYLIQGASQGHDVTIIERAIPSINYGHKLTWTILQLSTDTTLPHIYIDGHKHLQDIYQSVFTNFGHYRNIDQLTNSKLNYFSAHFATFGSPEETLFIDNFIDKKML